MPKFPKGHLCQIEYTKDGSPIVRQQRQLKKRLMEEQNMTGKSLRRMNRKQLRISRELADLQKGVPLAQ